MNSSVVTIEVDIGPVLMSLSDGNMSLGKTIVSETRHSVHQLHVENTLAAVNLHSV